MAFRTIKDAIVLNNLGDLISGNVTTTTNTATAVATYTPPANCVVYISVVIVGRRTDGANAGDGAAVTLTCAYTNTAGTLTQIGSDTATVVYHSSSISTSTASSSASSGTISLKIAGTSSTTVNWFIQSGFAYVAQ